MGAAMGPSPPETVLVLAGNNGYATRVRRHHELILDTQQSGPDIAVLRAFQRQGKCTSTFSSDSLKSGGRFTAQQRHAWKLHTSR